MLMLILAGVNGVVRMADGSRICLTMVVDDAVVMVGVALTVVTVDGRWRGQQVMVECGSEVSADVVFFKELLF